MGLGPDPVSGLRLFLLLRRRRVVHHKAPVAKLFGVAAVYADQSIAAALQAFGNGGQQQVALLVQVLEVFFALSDIVLHGPGLGHFGAVGGPVVIDQRIEGACGPIGGVLVQHQLGQCEFFFGIGGYDHSECLTCHGVVGIGEWFIWSGSVKLSFVVLGPGRYWRG